MLPYYLCPNDLRPNDPRINILELQNPAVAES